MARTTQATMTVSLTTALFFIAILLYTLWPQAAHAGNAGAIWTTRNDCGAAQQDVNHYQIGEDVYINGSHFAAGTYSWTITGRPGQASEDPGLVVKSGSVAVDAAGAFCVRAYTVADDDGGEYQVKLGTKGDNYRVTRREPTATAAPTEVPPTATLVPTEVQPTATAAPTELPPATEPETEVQPTATPSAPSQPHDPAPTQAPATSTPPSDVGGETSSRPTMPVVEPPAPEAPVAEMPAVEVEQPAVEQPTQAPAAREETRPEVVPTAVGAQPQRPAEVAPVPAMLPETGSAPTQHPLVLVLGVALLGLGLLVRRASRPTGQA